MPMDWFEMRPGRLAVERQSEDNVVRLFSMTTAPDIVRLPSDYGGTIAKVVSVDKRECPECECLHDCWHLDKKEDDGHVAVIECPVFGKYLWICIRDEP